MATDPGLLTQWYSDYTAANPAKTTPAATTNDQAQTPASTGMLASAPAPAGFTPAQATATNWTPDANSTVAGQVAKITAAGSPLIDQATTAAKQQSSARGLLNSSLGVTAGLDAAYRTALPIAQADALTYGESGKFNANAANSNSQFNTGQVNDAGMQQAGFVQQEKLQTQDFAQQNKLQADEFAARYDLAGLDVQTKERLQKLDFAHQEAIQQANAALQKGLAASDQDFRISLQNYSLAVQKEISGKDNATKLDVVKLDAENRTKLADIEAKYKNELQANSSMASTYQSMVDSYTRTMLSPDLDEAAKITVTKNLTQLYENTLRMQSDISGLQLGTLLADDEAGPPKPLVPRLQPIVAPASGASPTYDYDSYANPGGY